MPMDPRLLRPRPKAASAPSPDTDPPVQLKAESNLVLVTEDGQELTTE
jgi:hypothetical protein